LTEIREDLPVTEDWELYERAVCKACGNAARVHPDTVSIWGCLECKYSTRQFYSFFRVPVINHSEDSR
jgi:ribosomal protein L37AE/L43A